jgi:cell division protein FtsB
VPKPRRPFRSSDKGRSRIGDITRQISLDGAISEERRLNRSRRGTIFLALAAVAVAGAFAAALFGIPVRTYLGQDETMAERNDQLTKLQAVNADLEAEVARLRTDDGIREAAREELGYVEEGEQRASIVDTNVVPTVLPVGWPYDLVSSIVTLKTATSAAVAPPAPSIAPATAPIPEPAPATTAAPAG